MSSFHDVASGVSPTRATILRRWLLSAFAMWADQFDTAFSVQSFTQGIAVCGAIVDQMLRDFIWNLQAIQGGLNQLHFAVVGGGQMNGERCAMRVNDIDDFRSFATFRVADSVAPFFARANQASAAASFQSI